MTIYLLKTEREIEYQSRALTLFENRGQNHHAASKIRSANRNSIAKAKNNHFPIC